MNKKNRVAKELIGLAKEMTASVWKPSLDGVRAAIHNEVTKENFVILVEVWGTHSSSFWTVGGSVKAVGKWLDETNDEHIAMGKGGISWNLLEFSSSDAGIRTKAQEWLG